MLSEKKTCGVYVHVPWCRRRCPYCDFYFVVGTPKASFANHILSEWDERKDYWHIGKAKSLYFGGGTPSLLKGEAIEAIWSKLLAHHAIVHNAEVTLECNPEDLDETKLLELRNSPINRLSLGVQSFDDAILAWLGRAHRRLDVFRILKALSQTRQMEVSLDLIIGVPGEDLHRLEEDVKVAIDSGVGHFSTYLLTVEENTALKRRISKKLVQAPNEDLQVEAYERMQALLISQGFLQYDVSSFAKPGKESVHNQNYWGKEGYIGLGPGAHSMKLEDFGSIVRAHNKAQVSAWLIKPVDEAFFAYEHLSKEEALLESLAFGLRNMAIGIDPDKLSARHQCSLPLGLFDIISARTNKGWLKRDENRVLLTQKGALFADAIMRDILGLSFDSKGF